MSEERLMQRAAEVLWQRQLGRLKNAEREMAAAQQALGERYHMEDKEGGGYTQAMIHREFYAYWGTRLGYECWKDPEFVRQFLRDNAAARVRSRRRKPQVSLAGVTLPSGVMACVRMGGNVRERKVYS